MLIMVSFLKKEIYEGHKMRVPFDKSTLEFIDQGALVLPTYTKGSLWHHPRLRGLTTLSCYLH